MKALKLLMVPFVLIFSACGTSPPKPSDSDIETAIAKTFTASIKSNIQTSTPQAIKPSNTPISTDLPNPTNALSPTYTPSPTFTPTSLPTSTPAPEPIKLTGKGNKVLDITKWKGAALLHIINKGGSNFIVHNYDGNGEFIDGLVNVIGKYDGVVPLDFSSEQQTARLEIKSSGEWEITILPLTNTNLPNITVPSLYESKGDAVLLLTGSIPDIAQFDYLGDSNFIVHAYDVDTNLIDGIVNEIGPYNGEAIIPKETVYLEVKATGNWKMDIKGDELQETVILT